MPARFIFIVNPASGRGRGSRSEAKIRAVMERHGVPYQIYPAVNEEQAFAIARTASEDAGSIVAVGGDGTVHHVARGLMAARARPTLGVLPAGTGNDFARAIGMPFKLDEALEALLRADARPCDLGRVSWVEEMETRNAIFVNVLGCGFDAVAAAEVRRWQRFPRLGRYAVAAVAALPRWKSPSVRVADGESGRPLYEGKLLLMSTGNGATAGGGIRLTPGARIDDGTLDVCLVHGLSVARALRLLPAAVLGRHTTAPEVQMLRVAKMTIASDSSLPLHADGEVLTQNAREVAVHVEPHALDVLIPP